MKPSVALANVRQLASLGHDAKVVTPALVEALRAYVGFDICSLVWVDDDCRPVDSYIGVVRRPELHALYLSRFFGRLEREAMPTSAELLRGPRLFDTAAQYGRRYYGSAFFDTICRPADLFHATRVALRDGARPLACLVIGRPPGARDFSLRDHECLVKALPFVCHALSARVTVEAEEEAADGPSGLLIVDGNGALRHMDSRAAGLLRLAVPARIEDYLSKASYRRVEREWLRPIARRLLAAARDDAGRPPMHRVRNAWGQFTLRGYRLRDCGSGMPDLVGIQITRYVPLSLRLIASSRAQTLPLREKTACLWLARGLDTASIAARMGVSPHTVVSHVRSLFRRFGAGSRAELIRVLMDEAPSGGTEPPLRSTRPS